MRDLGRLLWLAAGVLLGGLGVALYFDRPRQAQARGISTAEPEVVPVQFIPGHGSAKAAAAGRAGTFPMAAGPHDVL